MLILQIQVFHKIYVTVGEPQKHHLDRCIWLSVRPNHPETQWRGVDRRSHKNCMSLRDASLNDVGKGRGITYREWWHISISCETSWSLRHRADNSLIAHHSVDFTDRKKWMRLHREDDMMSHFQCEYTLLMIIR